MRYLGPVILLAALPGVAQADCPPVSHDQERLALLMEAIRVAPTERHAREVSDDLWAIWATAPDAVAQRLLDDGMARRRVFDFAGAIASFDELIAYCPDYAEGYNQRAFALFLRQDYALALEDLDRAIARSPLHIAALSGRALTLMGLGRMEEAQNQLREALELNPWLPERRYLVTPPGQDL